MSLLTYIVLIYNILGKTVKILVFVLTLAIVLMVPERAESQSFPIGMYNGQTITTCSGTFYDAGGAFAGYTFNENYTITFCSADALNTHIKLYFNTFNVQSGDTLFLYDGTSVSSPLMASFHMGNNPSLQFFLATMTNSTGCITARFVSDSQGNASGWSAGITCNTLCQQITAAFDSSLASHWPNDSGYIDICLGEAITFAGKGDYPYNTMTYPQADSTSLFVWQFSDGTSDTGTVITHIFDSVMGYDVNLRIIDDHGCSSNNSIGVRVRTGGIPLRRINPLPGICLGDTATLTIGNGATDHFIVRPVHHEQTASLRYDSLTFIPDGGASGGQCYTASVTFNLFDPGQTVLDSLDILGVRMNAEHTWVGDLKIRLVCPNGQSVILKDYIQNGGADLGQANSNDCLLPWCVNLADQNPPGAGWTYTWSMGSTAGVMNNYVTQSQVDSVTYLPEQSFTDLAGCPLNGTWTLEVCDYWAYDNGYIFWWGLEIDPSLIPQAWEYTVAIDSLRISGQDILVQNDSELTVFPAAPGQYPYQFEIWDEFGCHYDTSFSLTVHELPVSGLPSDTLYCEGSPLPVLLPDSLGQGSAYAWWKNGSLLSTSQSYQPIGPGAVVLGIVDPNGCTDQDTIMVSSTPKPIWTVSTLPATCGLANGQATVTFIDGAGQIYWITFPPVAGPVLSDAHPGSYVFTISDDLCTYTDSVSIGYLPPPSYTVASIQEENCGQANGEIHLSLSGGYPPYVVEWHTEPTQFGTSAIGLSSGLISFTLSDSLCGIDGILSLGNIPGAEADFSFLPSVAEMPDPIYRFRDESHKGVVLWAWDFGDGHGTSNDQNPVYRYDAADTFRVTLITTDTAGCLDTARATVAVRDFLTFYIPNAFTPNGDGLNDGFGPVAWNIEVEDYEMSIFDRWGKQVFFSRNPAETWNGKVNNQGERVPVGAYAYRILLKAVHRPLQQFRGTVTVY